MKSKWKKLFVRKNSDVPTLCGVLETAYREIWRITGRKSEYLFGYFNEKHFTYYIRGVDERVIGRELYRRHFRSPQDIIRLYKRGQIFLKDTHTKTEHWKRTLRNSRPYSLGMLSSAFGEFRKDFDFVNFTYSIMPWWALEAWQHDFEDRIKALIRRRQLDDQYDVIISSLFTPWKSTAIGTVSKAVARGVSIRKLVRDYQFLRSWTVVWHKPITAGWVRSTAQSLVSKKFSLWSMARVVKHLHPSPADKKMILMAPYASFFKDWRDDLRRKHAYEWSFLFEAMAKHFRVSTADMGYFTLNEISHMLKSNTLDHPILKNRKRGGMMLSVRATPKNIVVMPLSKKYRLAMQEAESHYGDALIRGIAAHQGKVQGIVRIVRNVHDVKRVGSGDVLVSNTTHPNYLQAMKKAVAFVTDEGGIISHAAIVAREFKKPCIVGTKVATHILKDGDRVEVDATKGIVRKI